jgi:hypothetical protein
MKKLILLLSIITLTSAIGGCRSVKKDKTQLTEVIEIEESNKENETEKSDSNMKKVVETKTLSRTATIIKKTTIRPVDPTKPSSTTDSKGNTTTFNNAERVEEETTTNNTTFTDEKASLIAAAKLEKKRQIEENKKLKSEFNQQTLKLERKRNAFVGLIIAALAGIVLYYNRSIIKAWFKRIAAKIWWV